MIRVFLVEDNEVVRNGLAAILPAQGDFKIAGQATNGLEALDQLKEGLKVDVALIDLNMPVMDGIELTRRLSEEFPMINVVILTMHDKSAFVQKAAQAGAKGYALKHAEMDELYGVLKSVHSGKNYFEDLK